MGSIVSRNSVFRVGRDVFAGYYTEMSDIFNSTFPVKVIHLAISISYVVCNHFSEYTDLSRSIDLVISSAVANRTFPFTE